MLLPGIIAFMFMLSAFAVISVETTIGRNVLFAYYQWHRRRHARRLHDARV